MEHHEATERFERNDEQCALVQDLLPLYLDGEVSSSSRALIAQHINQCPHCAGFLAGARSVREQLGRDQVRETEPQTPGDLLSLVPLLGAKFVGVLGLMACVALLAIATVAFVSGSSISVFMPFDSRSVYMLFGVCSLAALALFSLDLVSKNPARTKFVLVLSIVSIPVALLVLAILSEYYTGYRLLSLALLGTSLASLVQNWQQLQQLRLLDFAKYSIGFGAVALGITMLLSFVSGYV